MRSLLVVLLFVAVTSGLPHSARIFGGENATEGQFPYMASINFPAELCGAAIINKNWVLTVANCAMWTSVRITQILVGTTRQPVLGTGEHNGTLYNITQIIMHEDFNMTSLKNDIALMHIDGDIAFDDDVQPIEFGDPDVNATCTALGWGYLENQDFTDDLKYVELRALGLEECQAFAAQVTTADLEIGPEQLCTLGTPGKALCYGDSGGPLVCDGKLAGVASFGLAPCSHGLPDVFVRPSAYADWIQTNIENNS